MKRNVGGGKYAVEQTFQCVYPYLKFIIFDQIEQPVHHREALKQGFPVELVEDVLLSRFLPV